MFMRSLLVWFLVLASATGHAQQDGPALPIILEHADSLVGAGPAESGTREFLGNVRFRQGNVTVTCDRAVQNVALNTADLYGKVVVRQGDVTITAPFLTYDGNTHLARAPRRLTVREGASTISARRGEYSTLTHVTTFMDSVVAVDDSVRLWADTLVVDRDRDTSLAIGNVVVRDSVGSIWMAGDRATRKPDRGETRVTGDARVWQIDTGAVADTFFVSGDTLVATRGGGADAYRAYGHTTLVRGGVAARADTMLYDESTGRIDLMGRPVLWSDSMLLVADTIVALAPGRSLRSVIGRSGGILVSRTDTTAPDRFDQVGGDVVTLRIERDTVRELLAIGRAQSITFRSEGESKEGLAKVAADSIRAIFDGGQLSDVYWLGGVEGEHHPEPVVAGRATEYRLPNFVWRTDRPQRGLPPSRP
jgi:lipopolysaccharide export system protein LptA